MATTLLAVDDSNTMRKVLEITFAGEDYHTVTATSAADAMTKLMSERPSVALVDAGLDGDGYAVCQQIKGAAPNTAVILLTSKHQPYDRTRGGQVGADDFMDKPFDTQQLLDRVRGFASKAPAASSRPAAPTAPAQPTGTAASMAARPRAQTLSYGTPAPGAAQEAPPAASSNAPRLRTPTLTTGTPPAAVEPRLPSAAPTFARPQATSPGLAPAALAAEQALAPVATNGEAQGLAAKLSGLGLTADQVQAVLALSREVVEQAVWEVVPTLAETMIREEIARLTKPL